MGATEEGLRGGEGGGPKVPVRGVAVLALVCAVVFGGLHAMATSQPVLRTGDTLGGDTAFPYLLEPSAGDEVLDGPSWDLDADPPYASLDVTAFGFLPHGSEVVILSDGVVVARSALNEENALVRTATLDAASLCGPFTVALDGTEGGDRTANVFIDTGQTTRRATDLARSMGTFETGLLVALAIWGATLYAFKRSERYMLSFVAYIAILLVQVALFSHVWEAEPTYYAASRCSVVATVLLSVAVCYRLAGIRPPTWAAGLLEPHGIALASVVAALATYYLWGSLGLAIDWILYAGCAVAAAWGCVKAERGSFFVPAGLLLSTLLCGCGTLLGFLGLSRGFLYAVLLTTPPLFSIPFVLVAMVAVNRRFAGKFGDAERLNIELDALVAERTAGLREQESQRRQLMLNVFHDLRSPLFVLGDLARTSVRDSQMAQRNAAAILERTDMLSKLTNDLFYLAKLEEGRVIFAEDSFDAAALLAQSAEAWRASALASGVSIELDGAGPLTVIGDELRLKEAIDNLVANAVRHSHDGGSIRISLRRDGSDAVIEVADEGDGISPEDLPFVFRQYYSKTSRGSERSTGIGLSIAREIIEHMGGTIGVDSTVGEGTTMTVRLPAAV